MDEMTNYPNCGATVRGCEYCDGESPILQCGHQKIVILRDWTSRYGHVFKGQRAWLFEPGSAIDLGIKYCPKCGSRLQVEVDA